MKFMIKMIDLIDIIPYMTLSTSNVLSVFQQHLYAFFHDICELKGFDN